MTHPTASEDTLQLLFFGDIVGKPGREAVKYFLEHRNTVPYDMVLANVENTTHGFGCSPKHYEELKRSGIQGFTGGNHSFDRAKELAFLDAESDIIRPLNVGNHPPGQGAMVLEVRGKRLAVANVLGQTFMASYNSPWEALEAALPALKAETPCVLLDVHAETTAEKYCIARYASRFNVSAVVGTHTHVQTADERILPQTQTGFITDVGFNGVVDSAIGMEPETSLARFLGIGHHKLTVAEAHAVQICAVSITLELATGACLGITRIFDRFTLPETIKVRS